MAVILVAITGAMGVMQAHMEVATMATWSPPSPRRCKFFLCSSAFDGAQIDRGRQSAITALTLCREWACRCDRCIEPLSNWVQQKGQGRWQEAEPWTIQHRRWAIFVT